jgi:hypothetical protein
MQPRSNNEARQQNVAGRRGHAGTCDGQWLRAAGGSAAGARRPYARVITSAAETKRGLFSVHRVGERLYFEIPQAELGREILVVQRTAAGGSVTGFFGGGPSRVVVVRAEGNRVLLRQRSFGITADSGTAIFACGRCAELRSDHRGVQHRVVGPGQCRGHRRDAPVHVERQRVRGVTQVQSDRSFIEAFEAFPENINIEATQTGTQQPPPTGFAAGQAGRRR